MKRKWKALTGLLLALSLLLLLSPAALAEGGEVSGGGEPEAPPVTAVTLDQTSLTLTVGGTGTLTATVEPDNTGETVYWTSSDTGVVTVDGGTLTAVGVGTANVTAKAGDITSSACAVTVSPIAVTAVNITQEAITLPNSKTDAKQAQLDINVSPPNATDPAFTCESSNTSVATVDSAGVVTAVGPGTATVTVTTRDGGKTDACLVTVSGVILNKDNLSLVVGTSETLQKTTFGDAPNTGWEWSSSNSTVARVEPTSGLVTAMNPGSAVITCRHDTTSKSGFYEQKCTVTVTNNEEVVIHAGLTDGKLRFSSLVSQLRSRCTALLDSSLSYITSVSVPTDQGTLYYNYISPSDPGSGVASSLKYYPGSGTYQIGNITFLPKADYTGSITIRYTGFAANGKSYSGQILLDVEATNELAYTSRGEAVSFSADDFNAYCQTANGRALSYVTFTLPAARYGVLYYNYYGDGVYGSKVTSATKYYRTSNPSLDSVCFLPAENYTGTVSVYFRGADTAGNSLSGTVQITVSDSADTDSDIVYSATAGRRLYFTRSDFSSASYAATGYQLSYIRFSSLPSSSQGTLYYIGSTQASTGTSYYYSGSTRLLEDLSFLPAGDFSGTVTIPFTGTNTQGSSFEGTVRINVNGSGGTISYPASPGRRCYFDTGDFSDASYNATGYDLSYVRFTSLPSSSQGTLYYGTGTRADTGTNYYRSGSLGSINFLPDDSFSGSVSIPFRGTATNGSTFTGTVVITASGSSSASLSYSVWAGERIYLGMEGFADSCYASTGRQLNYVSFTSLPSSSKGVLYYAGSTKVSTGTSYYRTGSSRRLLEDVSFVAADGASGTVSIPFQGYDVQGTRFTGSVSITIQANIPVTVTVQISYSTSGQAVSFSSADFSSVCSQKLSSTLSKVRFTAPDPSAGTLYLNYVSPAQNTLFTSGRDYSLAELSRIAFVPKAGYSGTVYLPYTATDQQGSTYSDTVCIQVTPSSVSSYFSDMSSVSWAVPATDFLRRYGVVSGTGAATYGPKESMLRGDFILMLGNAFSFPDVGTDSFPDVPWNSYYATAIASAKALGIVTGGVDDKFYPGQVVTRQDAGVFLYRCLLQQGKVTAGSAADLARFSDRDQVASGAVEAMGALVRYGVFAGDDLGRLNPTDPLNRAEMAVILYNALT